MASLRQAARCAGVGPNFSVLRDVFGFSRRRVPPDPARPTVAGWQRTEVSVLGRVRRLRSNHYNVNVIVVGWDQYPPTSPSGTTRDAMDARLDYAVYRSHEIYAQRQIGLGRVRFYEVATADAQGLDSIATDDDLDELTDAFTVDNDGLDHFIPFSMTVPSGNGTLLGRSNIDGPCEKEVEEIDEKERDASVTGPWGGLRMARTFAHENGHYLGLSHPSSQDDKPFRLMTQTGSANRNGGSSRASVRLTSGEAGTVRNHCSVRDTC